MYSWSAGDRDAGRLQKVYTLPASSLSRHEVDAIKNCPGRLYLGVGSNLGCRILHGSCEGCGFSFNATLTTPQSSAASTPTTPQHVRVRWAPPQLTRAPSTARQAPPASSTPHLTGSLAPPIRAYAGQAHRPKGQAARAARKWFAKAPAPRLASGES